MQRGPLLSTCSCRCWWLVCVCVCVTHTHLSCEKSGPTIQQKSNLWLQLQQPGIDTVLTPGPHLDHDWCVIHGRLEEAMLPYV